MTIDSLEVMDGVAVVQFRLPTLKGKFLDWKISKKLLPGSLIILSPDTFTTMFIGLIRNRDPKEMNFTHKKFGYVSINI